jgi:hypothetical protein
MIVGQNEFRAQDVATTVSRVLEHVPTDVDRVREDLPRGLSTILKKALAKTREERYANAGELAQALRSVRPGTEEELQARLVALARRDFYDPNIASLLGFSSLGEREEAWKNPPKAAHMPIPRISSSPPTIAARPSDLAIDVDVAQEKRRPAPWPWIAGAIVGVALVAAGAWAVAGRGNGDDEGQEQPTFVVVQNTNATEDGGEVESEAVPPDEGLEEADAGVAVNGEPIRPRIAGTKQTRPSANSLTRAFTRRQGEVLACIRRNPSEAPTGGQIEVVFQVGTSGVVTQASLNPPALGSTALGRCVLGIANSTRFPAQAQPVRFRIPVRVQGI